MEKNQNNMDQLLKKKFEQFQPPPPESVWSGVKSGIPASQTGFMVKLFSARYLIPLVAASVIIVGIIILPTLLKKISINDSELNNLENNVSQQHEPSNTTNTEFIAEEEVVESDLNNTQTVLSDPLNQQAPDKKPETTTIKETIGTTEYYSQKTNDDIFLDLIPVL